MADEIRELTLEIIDGIDDGISWNGIEDYLIDSAPSDFHGTILEKPLARYLESREALLGLMRSEGIDV